MGVKASLWSLDQLETIAARAAAGDNAALSELGKYNEKIGRRMNQRMRELEKAGKTGDAYKRIQESLGGGTRFSQARTGSAEKLYRSALETQRALRYKETTLSDIARVDQKTTTAIFDKLGIETGPKGATKAQTDRLNRFFESEYWKNNKKYFSSDDLTGIAETVAEGGDDYADLMDSISEWMDGDDPFEPVADWIEIDW
jgi:hypothetical protein